MTKPPRHALKEIEQDAALSLRQRAFLTEPPEETPEQGAMRRKLRAARAELGALEESAEEPLPQTTMPAEPDKAEIWPAPADDPFAHLSPEQLAKLKSLPEEFAHRGNFSLTPVQQSMFRDRMRPPTGPKAPVIPMRPKDDPPKPARPDRADKRLITAHVDSEVYREFKVLAAQQGLTTDLMLTKALALLFDSFGGQPPAALRRKLAEHKL